MLLSDGAPHPAEAMHNYMAQHGARLVDCGYRPIPIMPGTKAPGRYRSGAWSGYPEWSRHCDRPTGSFELKIWATWPGCGVGIACGNVIALDIDCEAADIVMLARRELGDTPATRVGMAPKQLLVYRTAQPFRPIKRHPLEILAIGNQFVAYATHPDTGRPYQWVDESLEEIRIDRLPLVTQDQCARFLATAEGLLPADVRRSRLGPDRSTEYYHAHGGNLRGTHEAITSALGYIPNDDLPYDDWIMCGIALKGALGEAGQPLWEDWSARSAKNVPATTTKAWASFRPERKGAGSIYYYAGLHGWVPDHDMILNGAVAEVDISGIMSQAVLPPPEPAPAPSLPAVVEETPPAPSLDFVSDAPGLLGDMVRWMDASAISPQPVLCLGAALAFVGCVAGQRWRLDGPDTRSNVYIAALADSGSGKDLPRSMIKLLAAECGLKEFVSEEIASSSGLLAKLYRHNCRVYLIDELGHFIGGLTARNSAHYRSDILTKFTTLWSSAHTYMPGAERAELRDDSTARQDIEQPCVCVYGSTVPGTFWRALASGSVADGSMARWLVMQTPDDYPDMRSDPAAPRAGLAPLSRDVLRLLTGLEHPDSLATTLAIAAVQQPPGSRSPDGKLVRARKVTPEPRVVPLTPAAAALNSDLSLAGLLLKREHGGTPAAAVAARWHEQIRRVALIAALADAPTAPVLDARHLEWARCLVDWCQAHMLAGLSEHVADTQHEADLKRVLQAVGVDWTTGNALYARTRWLRRRDREEIVAQLVESGDIEVSREQGAGSRPVTLYRRRG